MGGRMEKYSKRELESLIGMHLKTLASRYGDLDIQQWSLNSYMLWRNETRAMQNRLDELMAALDAARKEATHATA